MKKIKQLDARLVKRWKFANSSAFSPIFLASKATCGEATSSFFSDSTCFFAISKPGKLDCNPSTIERMRKIHIKIDLLTAYMRSFSTFDQACTLEFATQLIRKLGGSEIRRTSCIISIDRGKETEFLTLTSFWQPIRALTGFSTVIIKMTPAYSEWLHGYTFSWMNPESAFGGVHRSSDLSSLLHLNDKLEPKLGPGRVEIERRDFYCLIYHPQAHLTSRQPPGFDVDELADPVDLLRYSRR